MRSPQLWLYLLGAVTVLTIALRRMKHRITPLNDEVFAKQVAIDHVHSGVGWVRHDGTVGSVNPALAKTLNASPRDLVGQPWTKMFPAKEKGRVEEAYRQSLLMGKAALEVEAQRIDGTRAQTELVLVSVHDHKTRFIGHYCLIEDRSRVTELEELAQRASAEHAAKV